MACHHYQPKQLPPHRRMAFHLLAKVASLEVMRHQEQERSYYNAQNEILLNQLGSAINETAGAVLKTLTANADMLLELFGAQGVALVLDHDCALVGHTPAQPDIQALVTWLSQHNSDQIFATQCLAEAYPDSGQWSEPSPGLLGISIFFTAASARVVPYFAVSP